VIALLSGFSDLARSSTLDTMAALVVFECHFLIFTRKGALRYAWVTSGSGHYGWSAVFSYTFLNRSAYPADANPIVTLHSCQGVLTDGTLSLLTHKRFLLYISATAAACLFLWKQ
jgi:hypothetical protein